MISYSQRLLILVAVLFIGATVYGQSYEAAKQFSDSSNPNGVWRYGSYAADGSQSQSGFRMSTETKKNAEGRSMWMSPGSPTGTLLCTDSNWIWMLPSVSGIRPAVRFVAPERGNYTVTSAFNGGYEDSDARVCIFYHGLSLYLDDYVSGKEVAGRKGYSGHVLLEKDEPLDFVVDLGKSRDAKRATTALFLTVEKYKAPELDPSTPTDKLAAEGLKVFTKLLKDGKLDTKCLRYIAHKNRNLGDEADMLPSESARTFLDEARAHAKSIDVPPSFDGISFPLQPGDILFIRFKWDKTGEAYLVKSISADKLKADLLMFNEAKNELSEVKGFTIRPIVGFYLLRPTSLKFSEVLLKRFSG